MALWSNIGKVQTIPPGVTHQWQIMYGSGLDVGVVVAAPNLLEINAELIAFDQGVMARPVGTELQTATHYTVKIRNVGSIGIQYNLDIGDWQAPGGQAPQAQRISELMVNVGALGGFALKKRAKRAGGRGKKRATRRR